MSKIRGFLVFTVNIGHLPPFKAEAFMERLRDQAMRDHKDPEWQIIMIPVRPPQETKFEVIVIDRDDTIAKLEARRLKALTVLGEMIQEEKEQDLPTENEVKDYILLMLGAPVVKIELDDQQLKLCCTQAMEEIEESPYIIEKSKIKQGALAFAKIMLGRVRSKFQPPPGTLSAIDGATLLEEGERDLWNWRQGLKG